jgi:hypothetical protein
MKYFYEMEIYYQEEAEYAGAEQWQLDLLKTMPESVFQLPNENGMATKDKGFESSIIFYNWQKFCLWESDGFTECVNFNFSLPHEIIKCDQCLENGYPGEAQYIVNSFYPGRNSSREHWYDKITQDEMQALVEFNRIQYLTEDEIDGYVPTTAEEINTGIQEGYYGYDAIDQSILIQARLKRLELPMFCDNCQGYGEFYPASKTHVSLSLWLIDPHKGSSQYIRIKNIQRDELQSVLEYLRVAANRNAQRFEKVLNADERIAA